MVDFPRTLLLHDMESPLVVHNPSKGRQTGSTRVKLPFCVCASVRHGKFKEVLLTRGKRKSLAWFWPHKTITKCQQALVIQGMRKLLSHSWRSRNRTAIWEYSLLGLKLGSECYQMRITALSLCSERNFSRGSWLHRAKFVEQNAALVLAI